LKVASGMGKLLVSACHGSRNSWDMGEMIIQSSGQIVRNWRGCRLRTLSFSSSRFQRTKICGEKLAVVNRSMSRLTSTGE
jgi:hypothetical protein